MELRHLRYFLRLADVLSFTRAADQLHITQPTLSHLIKKLENQVSTRLFERVGKRVRLTHAGKILLEHAQKAVSELDSATAAMIELQGLMQGNVAIGVLQSFNSFLIPPVVSRFSMDYPGIHVAVRQLPKQEMEKRLADAELDFGIAYVPPVTEKVEVQELFDESMALVVGRDHPLYGLRQIQFARMGDLPLAMLTPEFPVRPVIEAAFTALGRKPRIVFENNSIDAILETVRCSTLATILAARKPRTIPGLHCIDLEPAVTRTAAIFWRRGGYKSGAAQALADLIVAACAGSAKTSHRRGNPDRRSRRGPRRA